MRLIYHCGVLVALTTTIAEAFAPPSLSSCRRNVVVSRSGEATTKSILLHAVSTDDDIDTTRRMTSSSSLQSMAMSNQTSSSSSSFMNDPLSLMQTSSTDTVEDGSIPTTSSWMESLGWRSVIVALCIAWASNFPAAKLVMAEPGVDSSLYALSRFGVAAIALAPFAVQRLQRRDDEDDDNNKDEKVNIMDGDTLKQALICGSWVAFGYLGQTLGLLTTTASKSCVICSMHCVFVAAIAEYWRVQKVSSVAERIPGGSTDLLSPADNAKFDFKRLIPAAIAVAGVAIVELKGAGGAPTIGDALSFAQPVGFGMGYLILEDLMGKKPEAALPVSAIKLAVVAAASFLLFEITPMLHGSGLTFTVPDFSPILSSPMALGGILYTGLVTTALALWIESIAFAKVPATDASLILTTEPLFAAGIGAVTLGETFGTSDYVGASLIVGACALSIFLDGPSQEHGSVEEIANYPHPYVDS